MKTKVGIFLILTGVAAAIYHYRDHLPRAGGLLKLNTSDFDGESSSAFPELSFTMLDGARPLDLFEMAIEFPETLRELDGRRVRLVGFMAPFDDLKNMRRCMIVPSYVGCNFCSPPDLSQVVFVAQGDDPDDETTFPFIEEACSVSGTFRISRDGSDRTGAQLGFLYSLEDAVISPYLGDGPARAPGHATTGVHSSGPNVVPIPSISPEALVEEVSALLGKEPLSPISFIPVSPERFRDIARDQLELEYFDSGRAGRAQAFALLGLFPEGEGWVDTIHDLQLTRATALASQSGEEVHLLNTVPESHPYVRLWLVGEIAAALTRQYFPLRTGDSSSRDSVFRNDDELLAEGALRQGINSVLIYRYARSRGISTSGQPPSELLRQNPGPKNVPGALYHWMGLRREIGPFFVDYLSGSAGPLARVDPALEEPPLTTMELFRPRWYEDKLLWRPDPVPRNFVDASLPAPAFTNVLGVGGLVSWLSQWYTISEAKMLARHWTGDRWAVWELDAGESLILLETRWMDDAAAQKFREAIPYHPAQRVLDYEAGSRRVRIFRGSSEAALGMLAPEDQAAPHKGIP